MSPTRRVLIVDDDKEVVASLQAVLASMGDLKVAVEAHGDAAMERLSRERFDLVISDFQRQGADGLRVLREARRCNPHTRRALLTGVAALPATHAELHAASVDAYVEKPLNADKLAGLLGLVKDDAAAIAKLRADARAKEGSLKDKHGRG